MAGNLLRGLSDKDDILRMDGRMRPCVSCRIYISDFPIFRPILLGNKRPARICVSFQIFFIFVQLGKGSPPSVFSPNY